MPHHPQMYVVKVKGVGSPPVDEGGLEEGNFFLPADERGLGLSPLQSQVNFILVDIRPSGLASDVLARRTMREGVLVRDCQSFDLGKGFIRVAVRSREENRQLIDALKKAVSCRD